MMQLLSSLLAGISGFGLLILFAKSTGFLLLAQAISEPFERSPAAISHAIWLIAICGIGVLPLVSFLAPQVLIALPVLSADRSAVISIASPIDDPFSWLDVLLVIYLARASLDVMHLIYEMFRIVVVTVRAQPVNDVRRVLLNDMTTRSIALRESRQVTGPVTWGGLRPVILLPPASRNWSMAEQKMVLLHELAHIQRCDWLAMLFAQFVRALYWPVPGISNAVQSLSLQAERACDDLVLRQGLSAPDYAALLVRQARTTTLRATVALGNSSELSVRVRHIIDSYAERFGERQFRMIVCTFLVLTVPIMAMIQVRLDYREGHSFNRLQLLSMIDSPLSSTSNILDSADIVRPERPRAVMLPPLVDYSDDHFLPIKTGESELTIAVNHSPVHLVPSVGKLTEAQLLVGPAPVYPKLAQRRNIEGYVQAVFDIDQGGRVVNARIKYARPSGIFDRAVLDAIKQYRFKPGTIDGEVFETRGHAKDFYFRLSTPGSSVQVEKTSKQSINSS